MLGVSCLAPACFCQALVEPVAATWIYPGSDADSVATWVAPDPADSLVFVTEKNGDRVEVWSPVTGRPYAPMHFIGGDQDSDDAGQFDRPNAVWVVYHVPFRDEFVDILLVCEQLNGRVQIFRLPELTYFGQFASGDLSRQRVFGRGIAPYHDGEDHFVIVTDRSPIEKIKTYRLVENGEELGAELVSSFGDEEGKDALNVVESVLVDTAQGRIHVCGDEWRTAGVGIPGVRVFDLAGEYTGVTYGEPQFQFDVEGIVLYETSPGDGYIIISDQYNDGEPNEYEVYDRATLEHLGHFESPPDGELVTRNTDGIYLEQRPFPGFPNGAFYAINDDMNLHIYDWTDIAEAMELEITALDRPFALEEVQRMNSPQRSLWHEDSSWWGLFTTGGGLEMRRLEDGTFAHRSVIDPGVTIPAVAAAKTQGGIIALAAGEQATAWRLDYQASSRSYEETGRTELDLDGSVLAGLSVDPAGNAWVAWSDGRWLLVNGGPVDDFSAWLEEGRRLEPTEITPQLTHLGDRTVLLAADGLSAFACFHADDASARSWTGPSRFAGAGVEALSAVVAGDRLVVLVSTGDETTIWTREENGEWEMTEELAYAPGAVLCADSATGELYLACTDTGADKRSISVRTAAGAGEPFGPPRDLITLPGVDMGAPLASQVITDTADDLVIASIGNDGSGYFERVRLAAGPDLSAPVTLQHSPPPGAEDVAGTPTVSFRIVDRSSGIDRSSLRVLIDGQEVPVRIRGLSRNLLVEADLPEGSGPEVLVHIEAADTADPANLMVPFDYSFATQVPSQRGDFNSDTWIDISDAISLLLYLFAGGAAPGCNEAGDVDDNGRLELTDAIFLLTYLFRGGPEPVAMGPEDLEACGTQAQEFTLTSPVFEDGSIIPPRNTCESDDVSPPFEWNTAPEGTRSFALTCIDIDSSNRPWIHWVSWDIPAEATALGEDEAPPVDGRNSWRRNGYGGPCPGRGSGFHRYVFTLHALDVETLNLSARGDLEDLEEAMEGHVLDSAVLTGRYRRD